MSMLKKTICVSIVTTAIILPAYVMAAPMEHTIKLQASVPTSTFTVLPSDPSWIGDVQNLAYNSYTGKLDSFSKPFDVKNTAGAVNAYLTAAPLLAGVDDNIQLTVKFNNTSLSGTTAEVVNAAQAQAGHVANLEIIPVETADGYKGGTYVGNVHIAFDAMVTPPISR
ncbi:CS1 type fimbrial major subunit [Pseudomonas helleri]|uniref:CS1 type fimbrial major subunit n=1 Tax=Pseudomonas helleri TaxID=1608996 RepID=UPI0028EA32BA|nr:CS1 type fimbrial major subunit [Pseudomonas helleri]